MSLPNESPRSEPRLVISLPIRVVGVDSRGAVFNEEGKTRNVSRSGISLILSCVLAAGSRISVSVRNGSPDPHIATFEVRWAAVDAGRSTLGARPVSDGQWRALLTKVEQKFK